METILKLAVIVGTTRPNRFSEKPARWILDELNTKDGVEAELLDLKDFPMPFFDQPVSPAVATSPNPNEAVIRWSEQIQANDGFLMVAGEYNHGYPAVLKNAIDVLFKEWSGKPVGFVSYGNVGGARAVEQLRQVVIELQMVPLKHAVHIPGEVYLAVRSETVPVKPELFAPLRAGRIDKVDAMLNELTWTARALKAARG